MQKLILSCYFIVVSFVVLAQAPKQFKYQAVLRDGNGTVLASKDKTVVIDILQGTVTGINVFTETHKVSTTAQGLINLTIGSIDPSGMDNIDWSGDTYFLRITVDNLVMGVSQLLSVPYALYAEKASSLKEEAVMINGDQVIVGNKTFSGTLTANLNANNSVIADLAEPVNNKDAATKAYVDLNDATIKSYVDQNAASLQASIDKLKSQVAKLRTLVAFPAVEGVVTDIDGNVYDELTIGTQVWMAENLKTTTYNDGTDITYNTNLSDWKLQNDPKYTWYNSDLANKEIYGGLYNWYAVNTGKLCPTGWRVPDNNDWAILIDYLDGEDVAGGKAKEAGSSHWQSPNEGADNSSGFTALPGGWVSYEGQSFRELGQYGYWWSASELNEWQAKFFRLDYFNTELLIRYSDYKRSGMSIRCIKN